jgi:BirA family transcriptional regulator, biotin operon repressor / biotin---[acetyl-CoA-carboxylase] ligase
MNDLENQIKVSRLTTLRDELGYDIQLFNLTKLILERLEYYYSLLKEDKIKVIIEIWKKRSDLFGRVVTVEDGKDIFHGLATGVDDNGVLQIKLSDGSVREVLIGDVSLSIKPHSLNDQPDLANN